MPLLFRWLQASHFAVWAGMSSNFVTTCLGNFWGLFWRFGAGASDFSTRSLELSSSDFGVTGSGPLKDVSGAGRDGPGDGAGLVD
jgi:hypothetical protein